MTTHTISFLAAAALFLLIPAPKAASQDSKAAMRSTDPEFFKTDEARRIGDQILEYQRVTGGWPKNIDMARRMTDSEHALVLKEKSRTDDSTIDNNATTMQMSYLARLWQQTRDERYAGSFNAALEYLLSGQYPNGGWPQFWPQMTGYQVNVTFNDDAMANTLRLFRDVIDQVEPYGGGLTDEAMRRRLQTSFDKGIDCILASQIRVDGEPTVWCQQNDPVTLKPASARAYELPSFCSQESAALVRLLMELPNPDRRVKEAVHGAMKWFDTFKLTGLRVVRTGTGADRNTRLVEDPSAEPIWARFYDLRYNEPYVCDRDGLPRRRLEQIGRERRNGYGWYGNRAASLYPLYNEWADRYDPKHKVAISLKTKGANENGRIQLYREPSVDIKAFDVIVKPGQSIQAAIDKAPEQGNWRIYVRKGRYEESLTIGKPGIVLVGESRGETFIEQNGKGAANGLVINIKEEAADCIISGFTISNNYSTEGIPVEQKHWLPHRFAIRGAADRSIIINCTINSTGNDALALWAPGGNGMYYHADLEIKCPGVDFICPRGWCYATRCRFFGDSRAMIWHDGRGDRNKKFVITNSDFDAASPTLLGRYHHDAHIYIVNCRMSRNILDQNIHYAYSDQVLDPCEWGERIYYCRNYREGGHSLWLEDNMHLAPGAPAYHSTTALWTFDGRWDPEQRIRDLWDILAY